MPSPLHDMLRSHALRLAAELPSGNEGESVTIFRDDCAVTVFVEPFKDIVKITGLPTAAELLDEFRAVLVGDKATSPAPPLTPFKRDVLAALTRLARYVTLAELAKAMDHDQDSHLRQTLAKLAKAGLVLRPGRGLYAIASPSAKAGQAAT